jgi:hypothetical protein
MGGDGDAGGGTRSMRNIGTAVIAVTLREGS